MKILIIKQLFDPEPTARSLDFALELKRNGHEVEVITSFPSYPHGKIYKDFRQRLFHRENVQGIDIIRVPIYPSQSGKGLPRMLNYMSYALSATFLGLPRAKKHDVVFAYHGALPVGIPAMINKIFRRVPFIYDVNDIWPDTLEATGMLKNKFLLSIVNVWCQLTYKMASKITVLSEGFKEKLISRNVPAEKVEFVNQWSRNKPVDLTNIEDDIKKLFDLEKFNVLYAGNVGKAQSLFSVIDAFKGLSVEHPNIVFTILGDGVERVDLMKYVEEHKISNVKFLDRVKPTEVGKYLECSDVLLVHLKDDPLFRITIPSKIIGCHFAGKPILLGIKGDAERVIASSGAGFCFEPDNVADLKKKIVLMEQMDKEALLEMGRKGKEYYEKYCSIEVNTKHFIELFNTIRK